MMEVKSPGHEHELVDHSKNENTYLKEELFLNHSANEEEEMNTSSEIEISHLQSEACHERSKHKLEESAADYLPGFHSPNELEVVNDTDFSKLTEHKNDKDDFPTSPGILGGHGAVGNNDIPNIGSLLPLCGSIVNKFEFEHDVQVHCSSKEISPMEHLDRNISNALTETCFPANKSSSQIEQDNQGYEDNQISEVKEEKHSYGANVSVEAINSVINAGFHLGMPMSENGVCVKQDDDIQKVSRSPSHYKTDTQHFGNIMIPSADAVAHFHKVNELENNADIEMRSAFSDSATSENVGIAKGVYDTQNVSVSPGTGRLMSISPPRNFISEQCLQGNLSSSGLDNRVSPGCHISVKHDGSCNSSPSLRQINFSPKEDPCQNSSQKVILQNDESEIISHPIESRNMNSPTRVGHRINSSSEDPNNSVEHLSLLRESYCRHDRSKHASKSPNRRVSPKKRGRSTSRSPTRRRDSPRRRKGNRDRSRSRSPFAREHHRRSPRRKHSPHRPPSASHSHRRSPRTRHSSSSSYRASGVPKPGRNLFIAGFSFGTTERDLESKFSRFGRITGVRVVRNSRTGDSRGFGFLSLERDEEADAAIRALDQTEWNGRIILVEKSKSVTR